MITVFLILMLLFAWVLIFVNFSGLVGFLLTRVPYQRTYTGEIKDIAKKLGISSKDTFYDLGCGDGRLLFIIEQQTGAKTAGFELTWWTYFLALIKKRIHGAKTKFYCRNFFKQSWSEANYIYGYLYPHLMGRVEAKFLADCKPGSVAIIRDFPFPNLKPVEVCNMPKKHEVYIYKKV